MKNIINFSSWLVFINKNWYKNWYLIFVLFLLTILNGWNYTNYPNLHVDEGVYTSQGWTTFYINQLSVYTYWYDHAPGGSIMIGLYYKIIDLLYKFPDMAILSGRLFVQILNFISNILFILILKKKTRSNAVAVFGLLALNYSVLNVNFHRYVLLDNLMVFWFIVSLYLLLNFSLNNVSVLFSGLMLGASFWNKESGVIYFLPMLIYVAWQATAKTKVIKSVLFFSGFMSIVLMYPVLALLKTELYPSGEKVSLIGTILFHSKRGSGKIFWDPDSEFGRNFREWYLIDSTNAIILLLTLLTPLLLIWIKIEKKIFWLVYSLHFFYFLFLIRGGTVLIIYVIPFIFTSAWLFTLVFQNLIIKFERRSFILCNIVIVLFFLVLNFPLISSDVLHYDSNYNHRKTLAWIRENASKDDIIAVDYSWQDLNDPKNSSKKIFTNSEWFFKFDLDQDFSKKLIDSNWKNIKYIVASTSMYDQMESSDLKIIKKALNNSKILVEHKPQGKFVVSHDDFFSVNADWSTIMRVNDNNKAIKTIYDQYHGLLVPIKGKTVDTFTNFTYSIDQADSLVSSYLMEDILKFDQTMLWTINNMIREDNILARTYGNYKSETKILDTSPNVEATIKMAYILLKAGEKWKKNNYIELAKQMITSIWDNYTLTIEGQTIIKSKSEIKDTQELQLDSGNFAPFYFREFSKYDNNNWNQAVDSSYKILNLVLDQYHIFPNTFVLDLEKLKVKKPDFSDSSKIQLVDISSNDFFNFDLLFQSKKRYLDSNNYSVPIDVQIDFNYNKTIDTTKLSSRISQRILETYTKFGLIPAKINPDNSSYNPLYSDSYSTTSAYVALKINNTDMADRIFRSNYSFKINTDYTFDNPTNKDKYYTWLAFAYHEDMFENGFK